MRKLGPRIDPIFDANEAAQYVSVYFSFESGARTVWHIHPLGQRLIVTAGVGFVKEWGGEKVVIREGYAYWIRPGVKHCHGALPTTAMTQIALTGVLDGNSAVWLEKVRDEKYVK